MPRDYDSDRPKRSWREIDRGKDRSAHRKEDRPKMNPFKQARADGASKVYKSRLDGFFDGDGKAPAHVKEKLDALKDTSPQGKKRMAAIKKIKEASLSSSRDDAVAAYLEEWALPADYDMLIEVLSCSDEEYVEMALEKIGELLRANRPPKRTTLLDQRLKRVATLAEEPTVVDMAKDLVKQLRLFS